MAIHQIHLRRRPPPKCDGLFMKLFVTANSHRRLKMFAIALQDFGAIFDRAFLKGGKGLTVTLKLFVPAEQEAQAQLKEYLASAQGDGIDVRSLAFEEPQNEKEHKE